MSGTAVIVGLGSTGVSAARHLLARGWQVRGTDTRAQPPGLAALQALQADIDLRTGELAADLLIGADCVVVSPGLSLQDPFFERARERGLAIIGDIELFARAQTARVVGITGTNGKSTVTTLLARMAQRAGLTVRAGGNLGPPALDLLDQTAVDLYVLELSSYQLETTHTLQLAAAAVLNVTPDHLDRYADLDAYALAKARIFAHCDAAIINLDDPLVLRMSHTAKLTLGFSLQGALAADFGLLQRDGRWWLARGERALLAVEEMRLAGLHNAGNALAALALAAALGLDEVACLAELREFAGLPHRAQHVAEIAGVHYVNDSKGTNVGATLAAVAGFAGPLLLIAGGDGKQQDFQPLRAALTGKVRAALLIGRDAQLLSQALHDCCPIHFCDSLQAAVRKAASLAQPGDTVLLSPACASLDMFRDYTHRGAVFVDAVRELAA